MADERLREIEREVRSGEQAALPALMKELRRLGRAFEECDACWGNGWIRTTVASFRYCEHCSVGRPKIREESVYTLTDRGTPIAPRPGALRRRVERNEGHWGQRAREVISRVMAEHPTAGADHLRKLLSTAYPFGERKYHPYKVWLALVRDALDSRR